MLFQSFFIIIYDHSLPTNFLVIQPTVSVLARPSLTVPAAQDVAERMHCAWLRFSGVSAVDAAVSGGPYAMAGDRGSSWPFRGVPSRLKSPLRAGPGWLGYQSISEQTKAYGGEGAD